MSRHARAFLRLARWLVVCFAFFAARPAAAAPAFDATVLVVELSTARATATAEAPREDAPCSERTTARRRPARSPIVAKGETVDACALSDVPWVLVEAKYLRNCSLLR